jgi:neutral ceramidase
MNTSGLVAGAATLTINPKMGVSKGGLRLFGGPIESIESDIFLSALILESSGNKLVMLTCDLGMLTPAEALILRKAVGSRIGLPASQVMLNLSHNHSSPSSVEWQRSSDSPEQMAMQEDYADYLINRIVECASIANTSLTPARIGAAWGESDINVYRREWKGDQDILGEVPGHPTDKSVGVIRVDDLNGNAIATLFRYSCHPVVVGARSTALSADFPGPARRIVEENIGGVVLLMQGCGGNLNPQVGIGYEEDCSDTNFRVGTSLGAEALRVALGIRTNKYQSGRVELNNIPNILFKPWHERTDHPVIKLVSSEESIQFSFGELPSLDYAVELEAKWKKKLEGLLSRDSLAWEIRAAKKYVAWTEALVEAVRDGNPTREFKVQAFRIGEIAIVGMNTETFFETGLEIQSKSPFPNTFVLGYTNGLIMYLPRAQDFPKGGWKIDQKYALPDLLPPGYCQPVLWNPDSEARAVQASLAALNVLK